MNFCQGHGREYLDKTNYMNGFSETYDVIVVGSGHAGIEASLASVRLGCSTLLLTQNLDTVGQMSCNPAIGGPAKGHIVREIDALGGFMGQNTDATGIQFRMLNRARGASVRAPRAQCDKKAYQFRAKARLEGTVGLDLKQANVRDVVTNDAKEVIGIVTDIGTNFGAGAVVITAGTFLRALLHIGEEKKPGGRMADASSDLSIGLRKLGFEARRFKTGTPCRINRHSIDFSDCEIQLGDDPPPQFSFHPDLSFQEHEIFTLRRSEFHVEQIPCWITHTTEETHQIIRNNLHRSALYSGQIKGIGPRYCPSIEDKVVKFHTKRSHQLFLEPEGLHTDEFYVNGISTSLPYEVQVEFLRTIPGLRLAEIMRPGYAVEYDFFPASQLTHSLETKLIGGLFFAGQVNGTSGYEEAAAQGLIAGAKAALKVKNRPALILPRQQSYIGVLIDDLVTKGTDEPYRMFTSRSENRLSLRQDTADQRLTPAGQAVGLVNEERAAAFGRKMRSLELLRELVAATRIQGEPLAVIMKRPNFDLEATPESIRQAASDGLWELLEAELKFDGYERRQAMQNRHLACRREQIIPDGLNLDAIPGLKLETRQQFQRSRPPTIAAAQRLSGVTPADIAIISIWLSKSDLRTDQIGAKTPPKA